jgi:hypothetical protein
MVVEAMWRNLKRLVLYLHNRPRVDFTTYSLVTQALPSYRYKLIRILYNPREGRALTLNGEQDSIRRSWLVLLRKEVKGRYDTNVLHWTCDCGMQKFHSYLLCKHLVQKVAEPTPDWWASVIRNHIPPFYDVRELLSPEKRVRALEPEVLGNHSWLTRMGDGQLDYNTPTISSVIVCITHL